MTDQGTFPPRGSGIPGKAEGAPAETWVTADALGARWTASPKKLRLGLDAKGRSIGDRDRNDPPGQPGLYAGRGDDRHIVTIAGSRAGKTSTALIPNLRRYEGSAIVIDPKGELARKTADIRRRQLGQQVIILDPYRTSGLPASSYNPLDELDPKSRTFIDDVALVATTHIVDNLRDPHWTDGSKTLLTGLTLLMAADGGTFSIPRLRRILLGDEGSLDKPAAGVDLSRYLFWRMMEFDDFDGLVARYGRSFRDKESKELNAIISVAREQTSFLDSRAMTETLAPSPLRLSVLKRQPTTIYLCLPASRLASHFRWLRLVLDLALIRLEDDTVPETPVLFLLEEFAALQKMRSIERAAGFFAGFGVRLWTVLQDIQQLRAMYPESWETFLGNAGVLQAFGNADLATTEYLSKRLGDAQYVHSERRHASSTALQAGDLGFQESLRNVPLLTPPEISRAFSRESHRQLILASCFPPIYCDRLPWE